MGKVVRCDSCQNLSEFDSSADSEVNSWGECSSCGAQIGLHTGSTYYRCMCGRGLVGFTKAEIGEGCWVTCNSCLKEYSVIPQSSQWDIYSCRKCQAKTNFSLTPGDFKCNCGTTLRVSLEQAKSGKSSRCPACGFVWVNTDSLWKLSCGCGLMDSATKLSNRIQFSTVGKAGLSQSAIATSQTSSREPESPSRVDQWFDRAFKGGDPIAMVANFVFETAEIGAEALKDSRRRKFEVLDPEIQKFLRDATKVGSQIAADHNAKSVDIHYGYRIDQLPPSISSGVGQPTEALIVVLRVEFEPQKRPIQRTRKFTVFNPETGKEIWPGAQMDIDGDSCFFQLHVGNVMNQGWGVVASWRNGNLKKVFNNIESLVDNCDVETFRPYSVLPVSKVSSSHW